MTGNSEPGKVDEEDAIKIKISELENELRDTDDYTLSGWMYESWGNLSDDLKKIDALVSRLFTFTSQTKNAHREVKAMSSELKDLMVHANRHSLECGLIADKMYDRLKDLSIQNTSLIATTAAMPEGKVVEKKIQERRENVPERKKKKAKMKLGNKKVHVAPSQGIVISKRKGESTYADMVKKLKEEIDLEKLGEQIKSVKRTKEDGIFMLVGKGAKAMEGAKKLKRAAEDILGGDVEVLKTQAGPASLRFGALAKTKKKMTSL